MEKIKEKRNYIDIPPLVKEMELIGLKTNRYRIGSEKVKTLQSELSVFFKDCGITDFESAATRLIKVSMTIVEDQPDLFEADKPSKEIINYSDLITNETEIQGSIPKQDE